MPLDPGRVRFGPAPGVKAEQATANTLWLLPALPSGALAGEGGIPGTEGLVVGVAVDAGIREAGILVALEVEDRFVHQGGVEDAQGDTCVVRG